MDKKLKIDGYIVIAKDCDDKSIKEIKEEAKKIIEKQKNFSWGENK